MELAGEAALLATWEAGVAAGRSGRALLLHAVARPAAGPEELLAVPVGERDAELFGLRGELFGEQLTVRVGCPGCAEEMEFDFDAGQVVGAGRPAAGPLRVESDGWRVGFRLPTTGDLAAAEQAPAGEARTVLLERCVLSVEHDGEPVPARRLPEPVQRQVAEAAAAADPCADVRLNLGCPECGRQALAELDIASYLWEELDAWARATLLDVHLLATAYGWSEPEVLALSPLRRRYYLELCADA
ncbi:T4 family baseplate hub assembly chaperone [Kitasatospora sp. NPDC001225]